MEMAPDVATLLDMLKPHLNAFSPNAADLIARIEGDVKVAKMNDENIKEDPKHEVLVETQPTQLDKQTTDAQEIASQLQALEAMKKAEEEDAERLRRARIDAGSASNSLSENLSNAANNIREQRPEALTNTVAPSSSSPPNGKETARSKGDAVGKRGGARWSDGNFHASDRIQLVRIGQDGGNQNGQGGSRPLQAIVHCESATTKKAEANECGRRSLSGSRPRNRTMPGQEDDGVAANLTDNLDKERKTMRCWTKTKWLMRTRCETMRLCAPERIGQEKYAEHDNIHPTPNEEEICSSIQLQAE